MSILVTIEHTVEELNSILMALAERPFKEVANLIAKLRSHGQQALNNTAAETPAPAATGTVTSVASGLGLTGGPITSTGTLSIVSTPGAVGAYASYQQSSTSSSAVFTQGSSYSGGAIGQGAGTWKCMSTSQYNIYDNNQGATVYIVSGLFLRTV